MGVTVIGPTAAEFPSRVLAPTIDVRRKWSDDWITVPELRLQQANVVSGGGQHSGAQLVYPYGRLKHPWQTAFSDYASWDLRGWWVRVGFFGPGGYQLAWVGKISTEDRTLEGADVARSGTQVWQAWGPERILQKIHVSESYWDRYLGTKKLGWVPSMNRRDEDGSLVGNRCEDKDATVSDRDVYSYGGDETWNHRHYIDYLLERWVCEGGVDGPAWTLGGAVEILEDLETVVEMGATQTVADLLARLIPREYGVDYVIYPSLDDDGLLTGFEVFVYALTAVETTFEEKTLPVNPRTVRIRASAAKENLRTRIVRTDDHRYEKIRVLGARPVVCLSLWGSSATPPSSTSTPGELEPKWTSDLEDEYKAGAGTASYYTSDDHDRARENELFAPVYQHYGAPDVSRDGLGAMWNVNEAGAAVTFTAAGVYDPDPDPVDEATFQTQVRETLSWLPLREGFDYTLATAEDHNPDDFQAELMAPCAWLCDSGESDPAFPAEAVYHRADAVGIGVAAPRNDWGVHLSASPNHIMAGAFGAPAKPTNTRGIWSYSRTVATIAFRTDQRLKLEIEIPEDDDGDGATPSGGVLDIEAPDAEFWLLCPNTVVGTDEHGMLKTSPDEPQVLRNDRDRLLMILAGALARYYHARARAEIHVKGLRPWGQLVGQILTMVEEAGDVEAIQAAITSVEWIVPDGREPDAVTIIRTGFAE